MSVSNYGELKTAVANWLERSDLTSRIPEFIAFGEDRIGTDLRVRAMETSADVTISGQTVALPARYLGTQSIHMDTDARRLEFLPRQRFWLADGSDTIGEPKFFTIEGENFVFGPYPSTGSYTAKLFYYARFDALSADSDTNWLFTYARSLLLYAALVEASPYLEDDSRALTWAALYEDQIDRLHKADKRDRFPEGMITVRSQVATG
jgi:hypothetical protein